MIHETAIVEDGALVGSGSSVWAFSQVRAGAVIGENTTVGSHTYIDTDVEIGSRCKIQTGVRIFHGVTIADGVFIGPGVILTNDRMPRAVNVDGTIKAASDWVVASTKVERGVSIGAASVVIAGCDIGEYAMIGAGAVVTKPVPRHALVVGNPAGHIGWVCRCGGRLQETNEGWKCNTCQELTNL